MKIKSITPAGTADVYNMEVEGTHDFAVESGIIAHNCYDEWRYVMMENPMNPPVYQKPVKDVRDDPLDLFKDGLMNTNFGKYDYIRY